MKTSVEQRTFKVAGTVAMFPVDHPWYYVAVPRSHTIATAHLADRGLVAITATLGDSTWETSLMPKGDGTHFIPLSAKVRSAHGIDVGRRVRLSYVIRARVPGRRS